MLTVSSCESSPEGSWSRHLETFGVLLWILFWGLPIFGVYFLYVLLFSPLYFVPLLYLAWLYYDRETPRNGGRQRQWTMYKNWIVWKWYAQYFPLKLVKTAELDASKNYILGCHPHGILGSAIHGNLTTEGNGVSKVFPGMTVKVLTLDPNFKLPIFRDFLLSIGGCSVSKESMDALLGSSKTGNMVVIVPGGARESLYSHPGVEELYLKNRKGFVRVAIKNGTPLVPVYSFGETDLYSQLPNAKGSWLRTFQDKCVDVIGVPWTIVYGRSLFQGAFGMLPRRHPVTTVVGSPIDVRQMDTPTHEYVDDVHAQYMEALLKLYNEHRAKYGNPQSDLIIH